MSKILRERSKPHLRTRLLFCFFAIIMLLSGIIFAITYQVFEKAVVSEVLQTRRDILHQIGNNIQIVTNEIESVSNIYYFNSQINAMLTGVKDKTEYQRVQEKNAFNTMLTQYRYAYELQNLVFYLHLYSLDGPAFTYFQNSTYSDINDIIGTDWYEDMVAKNGDILWVPSYEEPQIAEGKYVFSAARMMKHHYNNRNLGVLMMNVEEDILEDTYSGAEDADKHTVIMVDSRNIIVSSPDKTKIGSPGPIPMELVVKSAHPQGDAIFIGDGESKLLVSRKIEPMDWYIVETTPRSVVMASADSIKITFITVTLLAMMLAILLTSLMTSWLLVPINGLIVNMKRAQTGDFSAVEVGRETQETEYLAVTYNQLMERIDTLMQEQVNTEKKKREVEIQFLQAQINPHFLHNTLFSIKCLMGMGNTQAAEKMLMAFIRLLRRTFENNASKYLSVEDEINILKDYATVQGYKYEEKFGIRYRIEEDILQLYLPKMLLQPIVENAIFHGMEHNSGQGEIVISGCRCEDKLVFKIADSGMGMSQQQVDSLLSDGAETKNKNFNSIGLRNVNDRIRLCFGEGYGLHIESVYGKGTAVTVTLPVLESESGNDLSSIEGR